MRKEGEILFATIAFVLFSAFVSAASVSTTDISSTLMQVSISGADDLYAYEVNLSINSGSVSSVTSGNFLGATSVATYGSNQRNSYLYIYGSKLDSTQTGVDGSGVLANITHSGSLTLKGHTAVDSDGNVEYQSYNVPATSGGSTSSATGTSGGAATTTPTPTETRIRNDIVVTPSRFEINLIAGEKDEKEFTILNNGNEQTSLILYVEGLEDEIRLDRTNVILEPREQRVVKFNILVEEPDLYVGKIVLQEDTTIVKEIPIIFNVKSENFLFDARVFLSPEYRSVLPGGTLLGQISLAQVGPEQKVDIVANYIIKDFSGNIYLEESETFFVLGDKQIVKEFDLKDLPPGDYVLGLEITYPGAFAVSSTQFSIVEEGKAFSLGRNELLVIGIIAAIIIAGVAVILVAVGRRRHAEYGKKKRRG